MEIIIVGSGTGVPSLKRGSPCMAVKVAGETLIFDTGAGSLKKLLQAGITYHDIDKIFYTHLHPDHTVELASLLFASKYPVSLRVKDLPIIGPVGIKGLYSKMLGLYGDWIKVDSYNVLLQEIRETELGYPEFKVSAKPLVHSENSIGYRIEEKGGKSFVYSGDTDYCNNIIGLAKDADLLVLECSFPESMKVEGHLTPKLAGEIAREANCKTLLLTHLYPVCNSHDILGPCRKVFSGRIILGEDLMKVKI